ncbi:hypothetical protein QR680_004023 [Steinernema hermaphroditum]|uniref:Uncharacterized protein n=1 Tax=Steinernema hermaphroditum TaxID=289476 RepID=A0AA39LTC7_9BILA|nr:hypothetical protein QR680_004023 [Steinernema hermaphroditum]
MPSLLITFTYGLSLIFDAYGLVSVMGAFSVPFVLYALLRTFTLYTYLYFSILTVFLSYIALAKPLWFSVLFNRRNMAILVCLGYLWATVAAFTLTPRFFTALVFQLSDESDFSVMMVVQSIIIVLLYAIMIGLYTTAIMQMQKPSFKAGASKAQKNVLRSALIYCTPPNIFCALSLSGYLCSTVDEVLGLMRPSHWPSGFAMSLWLNSEDVCTKLTVMSQSTINVGYTYGDGYHFFSSEFL